MSDQLPAPVGRGEMVPREEERALADTLKVYLMLWSVLAGVLILSLAYVLGD